MAQGLTLGKPEYKPKDFTDLVGNTKFSEGLMNTHLGLYEGYVKNTNKALEMLRTGKVEGYAAGEVRRRFVWEFNGMRLHEFYFGAMTPGGRDPSGDSDLGDAISEEFGGFDAWHQNFREVGQTRGIGWVALTYDPTSERLLNHWINEHDAGALAGTDPLMIMDVFEHAFIRDFGTDREEYFDAYFDAVDWSVVERRYRKAQEYAKH